MKNGLLQKAMRIILGPPDNLIIISQNVDQRFLSYDHHSLAASASTFKSQLQLHALVVLYTNVMVQNFLRCNFHHSSAQGTIHFNHYS
ncbi:hypothetical protein VULLAG_LOCUS14713 [Vulpes lagopus]